MKREWSNIIYVSYDSPIGFEMIRRSSFFDKKYLIYLVVAILIGISIYNCVVLRFIVDDAYITMRYSRHLAEGHGPVYNIGERVEGYTNFLWMLILGMVYKIGLDMPSTSQILGMVFSVLTLLIIFLLSYQLVGRWKWLSLVSLIMIANNRIYALWSTSGLETSLFTFLVTLSLYLSYLILQDRLYMKPWLIVTCLLLTLTRPEGLMITFLIFLMLNFYKYRFERALFKKEIISWLIYFAVPFAIYLTWKLYFYHDLLPNTFHNKVNSIHYFDRGLKFIYSFLLESWVYLWFFPIILALFCFKPLAWVKSWLVILGVYVFYTVWVGGDWMGFRFYAPIIPLMAILFTWASSEIFSWAVELGSSAKRGVGVFVLSFYVLLVAFVSSMSTYLPEKRHVFEELATRWVMNIPKSRAEDIAEAFKILLKPDEVVAHSFAGFSAVYTDNRVIDMLGQNDAVISRQKVTKRFTPGHEKHPPPGYLEKNRAIFLYPWVEDKVFFDPRVYTIKYKKGKYLKFNTTWSQHELVKRFQDKGFEIYYEGVLLNKIYSSKPLYSDLNFDFETGNYKDWEVKGRAFGDKPAYLGKWGNSDRIKNTQGSFFVNSFSNNNDLEKGQLLSKPFKISSGYIRFLIGGGNHSGKTCINLLVDGRSVLTDTGGNSEEMKYVMWDVRKYKGKNARIQIVDQSAENWGHILIDDIKQIEEH